MPERHLNLREYECIKRAAEAIDRMTIIGRDVFLPRSVKFQEGREVRVAGRQCGKTTQHREQLRLFTEQNPDVNVFYWSKDGIEQVHPS